MEWTFTFPEVAPVFGERTDVAVSITAPAYVGPGDLVSGATAWWGLRAFSDAKCGSNAVRLRRSSDNAERDFPTLPKGDLDVASIAAWAGSDNLFVTKLYDQTGNANDVVQATSANQVTFVLNGLGALPIMSITGSSQYCLSATSFSFYPSTPWAVSGFVRDNSDPGGTGWFGGSNGFFALTFTSAPAFSMAGGPSAAIVNNTWYAAQVNMAATSEIYLNGNNTTGAASFSGTFGTFEYPGYQYGSSLCSTTECGVWQSVFLTPGQKAILDDNQHRYWSGPYVGPGDVVSGATAFWSGTRAYSRNTIGSRAVRLRRDSDNAEKDFFTIQGGVIDVAGIVAWQGTANLYVVKAYDQTGNANDAAQASAGSQPEYIVGAARQGVLGAMFGNVAAQRTLVTPSISLSQPFTFSIPNYVYGTPAPLVVWNTNSGYVIGGSLAANTPLANTTWTRGAWNVEQAVANSTSSVVRISGNEQAGDAGSTAMSSTIRLGDNGTYGYYQGHIGEVGLWPVAFTLAQRVSIEANQQAFYFDGSYVGPADLVTTAAAGWWGLRAFGSDTVGLYSIVRLRRSSDNAEKDFHAVKGGALDLVSIAAWAGSDNLFVTTLYDQTGNLNHQVQATAGSQPAFNASTIEIIANGSQFLQTASAITQAQPFSLSVLAKITGNFSAQQSIIGDNNVGLQFNSGGTNDNTWEINYSSSFILTGSAPDNAWHAAQGIFNTTGELVIDAVSAVTGSIGGSGITSAVGLLHYYGGGFGVTGSFREAGIFSTALTSVQKLQLSGNQYDAYWSAFRGPGDIVQGALSWWGLRAYSAVDRGTNAIRLRRSSDNAESDFVTKWDGTLDVASITTWAAGANLFVTKLYDQTIPPFADMAQATAGNQPSFILNGLGQSPVMRNSGTANIYLATGSVFTTPQPFTLNYVARESVFTAAFQCVIGGGLSGNNVQAGFLDSADNSAGMFAGSAVGKLAARIAWHAISAVFNGAASDLNIEGNSSVINPGTNGAPGQLALLSHAGDNPLNGDVAEAGIWVGMFSSAQSNQVQVNQRNFYGFGNADPNTLLWRDRVIQNGGTVSVARVNLVDALVDGLKRTGVWSKLDRLWIFAAENQTQALVDLIGGNLATAFSSPSFAADAGFTGNGSTSGLDTNLPLNTSGLNYSLNAASFHLWDNTSHAQDSRVPMGCYDGTGVSQILPFSNIVAPGGLFLGLNIAGGAGSTLSGSTGSRGFFTTNRSGASAQQGYMNGVSIGSDTTASSAVPTISPYICGRHDSVGGFTNGATDQISIAAIGGSFSATDAANFYSLLRKHADALGLP